MSLSRALVMSSLLVTLGCGDGAKKRPIGATCEDSEECASGLCYGGECLDPEADDDRDGLINRIEAAQGTNPKQADSDADGKPDPDEYEDVVAKDSDGDGIVDANESATTDADLDCLVDELDARNAESDGATSPRIAELCPADGVCAAPGAPLAVMCRDGLEAPACELTAVPSYEATETTCDALDNDCDGATDEGCDPLSQGLIGHWRLDGDGQDASSFSDHGTVVGADPAPDRFGAAGQAMRFDAPGDHIAVPATEHPLGEVSVTYTLWARPDRGHGFEARGLFAFGDVLDANQRSSLVMLPGRGCVEYVGEGNDVASTSACMPAGHWSFVAAVKTGRSVRFYLDGRHQGTYETAPGQLLDATSLVIGLSKVTGTDAFEQFYGVLDDLRVYDRELSPAELETLYQQGSWADAGTKARPAQSCLHVRDAAAVKADGPQWLDVDGDAELPAFTAFCDMTTDGGGWTLVWVYGFTNFENFQDVSNAVTPRPSWPVGQAEVPVSTTPPTDPTTPGAIDWTLWRELGSSFAVLSPLNDGVACEPGEGSLAHALSGWVDCRTIADVTPTCDGVVPSHLFFGRYGPSLGAQSLYYYFDGSTSDNWPTHDPCGQNTPQHVASPARKGGAVYLRATDNPVHWPEQCNAIQGIARGNGQRRIDPDGPGGRAPFMAECRFDVERGGWTRISPDVLAAMANRGDWPREYLYTKGASFYRSPVTTNIWSDASYAEATGLWSYSSETRGDGVFSCSGGATGDHGVGCGPLSGGIASGALGRVIPSDQGAGFDAAAGTTSICQAPPDAFETGVEACAEDVGVWVRARRCMPDEGSLIGDGGFDALAAATTDWDSPCWAAYGPEGFKSGFSADATDFPPGGSAPSLRADNPTLGNPIYALNLLQRNTSLVAGRSYTLTFWAKAAERRSMRIFVQPTTFDYAVFYEDVTLDTSWRRYEIGFEAKQTTWSLQLDFQLAETSTAAVWLDDVKLADAGPSPCGLSADGNLLGNGDFAQGRTCWRFGNVVSSQLSSLDVVGLEQGGMAAVVQTFGPAGEAWHTNLRYDGLPIEAGYRYRLSFRARSQTARHFWININRWDEQMEPWMNAEHPVGPEWRTYTYDFAAKTSSPEGGAQLELAFGELDPATVLLADFRLERLGADPCAPGPSGLLANSDWADGLACWGFERHEDELDLYAELDPVEGDALKIELSSNEAEFDYSARLAQGGLPLQIGRGYVLRFRAKGEAERRGYVNVQEWPTLHANGPIHYRTTWHDYELAFMPVVPVGAAGAKLEIGFGGPLATGATWFDDVELIAYGAEVCASSPDALLRNGDFSKSHLCWELSRPWDELRFEATSDPTTFGDAAPSLRLDYQLLTSTGQVSMAQRGLTLEPGVTYELTFKAKSSDMTNAFFGAFDTTYGQIEGGGSFELGPTWAEYRFDFTPFATTPGGVSVELQYNNDADVTIWLDDVVLVEAPVR